ncbi:MAG: hypothetical protein DRJ66_06875, partial [Thermoprotei archaeon]
MYGRMFKGLCIAFMLVIIFLTLIYPRFMRKEQEELKGVERMKERIETEVKPRLFPFYLPWNDSTKTIISLSGLLEKPAGKYGHVYVGPDGHLYVG